MSTESKRLRETVLVTDAFNNSSIEDKQKKLKSISDRCMAVATKLQVKLVRDVDLYVRIDDNLVRVDLRRFWTSSLVGETVVINAKAKNESFAQASRLLFQTLTQAGIEEGVWVLPR